MLKPSFYLLPMLLASGSALALSCASENDTGCISLAQSAKDCSDLGYSLVDKNVNDKGNDLNGCHYLSCPFNTNYKVCIDDSCGKCDDPEPEPFDYCETEFENLRYFSEYTFVKNVIGSSCNIKAHIQLNRLSMPKTSDELCLEEPYDPTKDPTIKDPFISSDSPGFNFGYDDGFGPTTNHDNPSYNIHNDYCGDGECECLKNKMAFYKRIDDHNAKCPDHQVGKPYVLCSYVYAGNLSQTEKMRPCNGNFIDCSKCEKSGTMTKQECEAAVAAKP